MRDANLIVLSSVDWEFNRQNPHEVALGFVREGNSILFIENTGVRSVRWRDVPRLWSRLSQWWRARGGVRPAAIRGLDIFAPLLVPLPYLRAATAINRRVLLRTIRRWLRRAGEKPLIVMTFLPTPLALEIIHELRPALTVYYCIDRMAESSPGARRVAASEEQLFEEADLVLVTSQELYDMARAHSPNVELLVSGVRCEEFERARRHRADRPHLLDALRRPLIGFAGSVRTAIDLELLAEAARLAPDLNFVLMGPQFIDTATVDSIDNIHLIGQVPHAVVVEAMARFDVGVLPYVLNRFTAAVMPVKLKEYLAAGLPVVGTPLPELLTFAAEHPGVITFASDAESLVRAIRTELARDTPEAARRRMTVAREYDQTRQVERLDALMHDALARSRA